MTYFFSEALKNLIKSSSADFRDIIEERSVAIVIQTKPKFLVN